jgi:hypothetical protein
MRLVRLLHNLSNPAVHPKLIQSQCGTQRVSFHHHKICLRFDPAWKGSSLCIFRCIEKTIQMKLAENSLHSHPLNFRAQPLHNVTVVNWLGPVLQRNKSSLSRVLSAEFENNVISITTLPELNTTVPATNLGRIREHE